MGHLVFVEHLEARCFSFRLDGSFRAFRSRFMTCLHVSFGFALKFEVW